MKLNSTQLSLCYKNIQKLGSRVIIKNCNYKQSKDNHKEIRFVYQAAYWDLTNCTFTAGIVTSHVGQK